MGVDVIDISCCQIKLKELDGMFFFVVYWFYVNYSVECRLY